MRNWAFEGLLLASLIVQHFPGLVLAGVACHAAVGWAMAAMQDATLVITALDMALVRRHPQTGLLVHSDRGSTYTSESYLTLLEQNCVQVSMGRIGNCYGNAMAESFFHSLKAECIDQEPFQTTYSNK